MNGADNSWFSERTKTWIVSVIMSVLVIGIFWGFYEAKQWQAEREQIKIDKQRIILELLYDDDN